MEQNPVQLRFWRARQWPIISPQFLAPSVGATNIAIETAELRVIEVPSDLVGGNAKELARLHHRKLALHIGCSMVGCTLPPAMMP